MKQKAFSFWGLCPPDSLTRGSAPRPRWGQARSYVTFRHEEAGLQLVPRQLNFFETQMNVMRNCVKRKKYGRKSRTNLLLLLCAYVPPLVTLCYINGRVTYLRTYLLTYISSTIGCANFGPDWPLLFKVYEICVCFFLFLFLNVHYVCVFLCITVYISCTIVIV